MNKIRVIVFLSLLAAIPNAFAEGTYQAGTNKLGINLITMVLLGDLNASYERAFEHKLSLVSSIHYITDTKFLDSGDRGFRFTLGARLYGGYDLTDFFIESKLGVSNYSESNKKNITSPLVEASFGHASMFNEAVYYEFKLGLTRHLETQTITPSVAVNVGARF